LCKRFNIDNNFNLSLNELDNPLNQSVENASQKNVLISGNVIRCDSGDPFSGVTLKVSDLAGNEIARTQTDMNGNYNFNFNSYGSSFKVTASYHGHVTLSKIINLNFNGEVFYGTANFQLGPEPVININAPAEQFLNETFNFNLNFDNVGNETGFGPITQLILPPQIQFNNASFLGAPVGTTFVGVFPGNTTGILTDPLSRLNVTGISGYSLYVLEYPIGSYTKGQSIATIDINALLLGNSTLGVPLNITAYPVFRFGANETGTTPIRGNITTAWVTPTVIKLTKTSDALEDETATGRNYLRTYTLTVDIANGQTVSDIDVGDIIPGNLQFIQILNSDGGTVIQQPLTTVPGGDIWIQFSSITGIIGPDRTITYQVFAPKFDNLTNSVLDPLTGLPRNATNFANVTGTYNTLNVSSSANYTLTLRSLAIQKGVTVIGSPPTPKPTDILRYDLNFQVSDYFSLNNVVIRDTLGDGQTFLNTTEYIPGLILHLPVGKVNLKFNLTNPNQFQMVHNTSTGITSLKFNITQLLIDNGYTGILEGGNYTGINYDATIGTLTFWSQINVKYVQNSTPIVSNNVVINQVTADGNLLNSGNVVSDGSGSRVVIVAPTSRKIIYKINGQDPVGPPYRLRPGDTITFSLQVNVPTTNLHDFYLMDYLPIPFLRASEFTNLTPVNRDSLDTLHLQAGGNWHGVIL